MNENNESRVITKEQDDPMLQKLKDLNLNDVEFEDEDDYNPKRIVCPHCHSNNVFIQTVQENRGSVSVSKTKSKYKEKGHGLIWWITIGWWWWAVDLFLWIFAFFPRLILRLFAAPFKKKKSVGKSTTISTTKNRIVYKTICTCQSCGYSWKKGSL